MKKTVDFLNIQDIKDNLIILKNNRYRAVITSDPINFALLSPMEQNSLEDAFASMLLSVTFPIQILSLTQHVNLNDSIAAFKANRNKMPESMVIYEQELERFLAYYAENTMINENYLIITYNDTENNYSKARGEMSRRIQVITEGLLKCNLMPRVLNTNELIDLLHAVLNPMSRVYASELIKNGALSLMKEGVSLEVQPA